MNRQPLPKQASRASRGSAGFTPQQVMILIIVAVLGFAALGLAAYVLLFQSPSASQALPPTTQAAQPEAEAIPPSSTAMPEATALPAACLQQNGGLQQGRSARVVDSATIEAQVDGNLVRIRYAGIQVANSSPFSEQAAAAARELIEGQDILLVQDPRAAGADSGEPLPRYILINDRFLNQELVMQGLGQPDTSAPEQACANLFFQAEQQARAEKFGLWQPKQVPTATFMPFVTLDPSKDAPCDCIRRPVCSDFRTHDEAQACFNACNDYNSKLDDDRDGIACEELP